MRPRTPCYVPKPWRGLIDGNTGYLYFWNPKTNITERVPLQVSDQSNRKGKEIRGFGFFSIEEEEKKKKQGIADRGRISGRVSPWRGFSGRELGTVRIRSAMERDFLGLNAQDSGPPPKEDGRGRCQDSVYIGSSAMQWPFLNKTTAMQPFMSFKQHEERPRKIVFDQFSSGFQPISTVDAFETSHKTSLALAPQKPFNLDRQGIHQYGSQVSSFGASAHQSNEPRMFPVIAQLGERRGRRSGEDEVCTNFDVHSF